MTMTELEYLKDSYLKTIKSRIISITKKPSHTEIILDKTIFYPQGGGQPSDKGTIFSPHGTAKVKHVRIDNQNVVHECIIKGTMEPNDEVKCEIDWPSRFYNMRCHSAGHIVHEAVMQSAQNLKAVKADHGLTSYILYQGSLSITKAKEIENLANTIIEKNLKISFEFVTLEELKKRSSWIPKHLPTNKPFRIINIQGFNPIPDGGTHVLNTKEIGEIAITKIDNSSDQVFIYYSIGSEIDSHLKNSTEESEKKVISASNMMGILVDLSNTAIQDISKSSKSVFDLTNEYLGTKSELNSITKQMRFIAKEDRNRIGILVNEVKKSISDAIKQRTFINNIQQTTSVEKKWLDVTSPGRKPPQGHLHPVTQAIMEITRIFERIGFHRVRHPEVDWDWYAFESLHMPPNHPARDEWETFHIQPQFPDLSNNQKTNINNTKFHHIVLSPHTSNGQVREMEKGKFPIRMINIAKCYRRQIDISHTPMFHQFEGLYIDKNVSISHLKGVFDYFVKQFFGLKREIRLRPFHFQFTEPSFEVDVTCGICNGKGCRLCKAGWLELGGAGMVHKEVLKNGGVNTALYNGFAFGWGIERTYMMKSDTKLKDIRWIYSNDIRFLEQF